MSRSRGVSHKTPLEIKHFKHNDPQSNSFTQHFDDLPSLNVISKSRPRAGGVGGTRKKGVFGKSIGEKQELRRAGRRGGTKKKNLELEVEDMEVTVKKNNLTQHQSTFDSELLSESTSPEKELDIMEDNKMDVDEDSDATQPLDTQPDDGAEFHFDEDDEVEKNDVYNNRNGGIDEDEDDTDVDSDVDENASVESELGSRRLFPKSTVKKEKKSSSNRRVIKDDDDESDDEDDMDMDVDTKKQRKKKVASTKGKSTTTKKNTNPRRKKTSTKRDDDTSDEETDYEGGKENSTKRGSNTNDTTSGKRRSERLKSNKPINLDESRFSEEDSERELDTDDEDITYSTRRVKGDKKRGGGKSSKYGKILCLSECCLGIHCFAFTPTHYDYHIPSIIKQASLPTNTWRKTARMMRSPRAATRPVNPQLVAPPSGETNPTSQRVSSFIYSRSQYTYTYLPMTDKLTLFTPLTNLSYSQGIIEKQKEPCRGK